MKHIRRILLIIATIMSSCTIHLLLPLILFYYKTDPVIDPVSFTHSTQISSKKSLSVLFTGNMIPPSIPISATYVPEPVENITPHSVPTHIQTAVVEAEPVVVAPVANYHDNNQAESYAPPTTLSYHTAPDIAQEDRRSSAVHTHTQIDRPLPSLTQLLHGFCNHMNRKPQPVPASPVPSPADQLKIQRYYEKLASCIESAFKMHVGAITARMKERLPLSYGIQILLKPCLHNPHDLEIINSFGTSTVDSFLQDVVHSAQKSFPPLPRYMAEQPTILSLHIYFTLGKTHNNVICLF